MTSVDPWSPAQYDRFAAQRQQPFRDLAALVRRRPGMRVVDLGCGSGEMTVWLHRELRAGETLGIDRSEAMLASARARAEEGLTFRRADLKNFEPDQAADLLFSNAALQWLPDQESQLRRLVSFLAPGGQLAVQVPAMDDHPSHRAAFELAAEEPFASALEGCAWPRSTLAPERYLELLLELGFAEQHVRLQIYPHRLPTTESVVEWVKGTLLLAYQTRLPERLFGQFAAGYRERLLAELGEREPYLYSYRRILAWGQLPSAAGLAAVRPRHMMGLG